MRFLSYACHDEGRPAVLVLTQVMRVVRAWLAGWGRFPADGEQGPGRGGGPVTAPDWAAVENAVASIAIIVGGLWAGWKWGYGEALRKRREYPDLDGALTAASVPLPGGKAYLTLQAVWRNPGPGPTTVCPEYSFVEQYELGTDPSLGSFRIAEYPGATKTVTVPLHIREYVMGPQTESVMTEHFVVVAGSVYAFSWHVCQGRMSRKDQSHSQCIREIIWSSPQSAATRADPWSPRSGPDPGPRHRGQYHAGTPARARGRPAEHPPPAGVRSKAPRSSIRTRQRGDQSRRTVPTISADLA
jgi:hypothetical protein